MNTQIKTVFAAAAFALLFSSTAMADDAHHKGGKAAQVHGSETTDAEVRKIDIDAGKITLKHGEIKHLDMPGMTMVFIVKDKTQLDKLKTGDKVKFRAINDGGKFTATDIQLTP